MEPLKFREMGYGSLEQFLKDCSETCGVERAHEGYLVAKAIASREYAHIFRLVSGQRKDKRKKSKKKVSLSVKRRASNFTGGRMPNFNKFSTRHHFTGNNYHLVPRPSILGTPPTTNKMHTYSSSTFSKPQTPLYTNLRKVPSMRNGLPPRFQKLNLAKSSPTNFMGNVGNKQSLQMTISNVPPVEKNQDEKKNVTHFSSSQANSYDQGSDGVKTNLSHQALSSLEQKLRELLASKPKGLWATRLRPEFKSKYGDVLPEDIREIIHEHFVDFIKIEEPIPTRENLYLKEGVGKVIPQHRRVHLTNSLLSRDPPPLTNSAHPGSTNCNGTITNADILPEVICLSPPPPHKPLDICTQPPSSNIKSKLLSPRTDVVDFKIELPDLPDVGAELKVFVCHIESLDSFFVQFADSQTEDLVNEMQEYYENCGTSRDIAKPRLNEYCCARYSKDKLWFRSKVLSVKEQKNIVNESYRCHVIYVDYGNDEYVISTGK